MQPRDKVFFLRKMLPGGSAAPPASIRASITLMEAQVAVAKKGVAYGC